MFEQKKIEDVLATSFKQPELIKRAFIHRSYINEHPKAGLEHNERLEFLGDAVLELVVTDHLYRNYENPEGELTSWRSALVKTESLASVAERLELGQYLLMSHGEVKSGGRARTALLANMIEAIIGAMYIDQGYDVAAAFIDRELIVGLPDILKSGAYIDAKSKFQEIAQERDGITPHYEVLAEVGPDHDKVFTVGVFLGAKEYGKGNGASKQAGQQAAAADALSRYKK
jgi:ribonuclease-3